MATTYKEMIVGATLTAGSGSALYTVPSGTQAAIHAVSASNPGTAPATVNLWKVPAGGSASNALLLARRILAPGQVVTLHDAINHTMGEGSMLYASGLNCGLNVSGVEYVPDN